MTARRPPVAIGLQAGAVHAFTRLQVALLEHDTPCAGSDEWCSEDAGDREIAARLCRSCPVLILCGEYAKANSETFGTWGGKDRTPQLCNSQEEAESA